LIKKITLGIHEALPFPVKYHQENGESVCTVKQADLEELHKVYRWSSKLALMLGTGFFILALGFIIYEITNHQFESKIVILTEKQISG
jgi:hypothetical protein